MTRLLDEHIQVLTAEHHRRIITTDGPAFRVETGLLESLRGAVTNGQESGGARGGSRAGAPLDLTALSLWQGVESTVGAWWREHCDTAGVLRAPVGNQLRSVAANVTDPVVVVRIQEQCEQWIDRIRALLEPPITMALSGACPECGHTHVSIDSDDGQVVYRAALTAYPDHAVCAACEAEWWGAQMHTLAHRIGATQGGPRKGVHLDA